MGRFIGSVGVKNLGPRVDVAQLEKLLAEVQLRDATLRSSNPNGTEARPAPVKEGRRNGRERK